MAGTEWAVVGGAVVAVCGMVTKIVRTLSEERRHEREMKVVNAAIAKGREIPALTGRISHKGESS